MAEHGPAARGEAKKNVVVGRGARPWWRPSSWSGAFLASRQKRVRGNGREVEETGAAGDDATKLADGVKKSS
jgi:hypothetical protein